MSLFVPGRVLDGGVVVLFHDGLRRELVWKIVVGKAVLASPSHASTVKAAAPASPEVSRRHLV